VRKFLFAPIFFIALLAAAAPLRAQIIIRSTVIASGIRTAADDPTCQALTTGTLGVICQSLTTGTIFGTEIGFTINPYALAGFGAVGSIVGGSCVETNGAGSPVLVESGGPCGGTPAGTDTQIQFNNAGAFGGDPNFTYNTTSQTFQQTGGSGASFVVALGPTESNGINVIGSTGGNTNLFALETGSTIGISAASGVTITSLAGSIGIGSAGASTGIVLNGFTSGSAVIGPAAVAGTPNRINLPVTTGTSGQVLTTDGGNPQQTSWTTLGGVTNIATASPITGGPITTTGTIGCTTCTTSASTLTANQIVMGGGTRALTTLGSLGTTTTVLHGNASGLPAFASVSLSTDVAGQLPIAAVGSAGLSGTSPITISAAGAIGCTSCLTSTTGANTALSNLASVAINTPLLAPAGATNAPGYAFTGQTGTGLWQNGGALELSSAGITTLRLQGQGFVAISSSATLGWVAGVDASGNAFDTGLCRAAAGVIDTTTSNTCTVGGTLNTGTLNAAIHQTATKCANGASPAVCAAAAAGVVAVPTGTNPTLVVNTTAITAASQIFLQIDESATISGTTCNTTLTTLTQPVVTARTAGTSFTIQIGSTLVTNPACVSYLVFN
jgi:hypothetical protein